MALPKKRTFSSATINLQPGTYHLRFIVDGSLITSPHLPTAVDFTNSLVNYIEVVKSPSPSPGDQFPPTLTQPTATEPVDIKPKPVEAVYSAPPGVHPPLVLPPTPELIPITDTSSVPAVPTPGKSTAASSVRKPAAPIISEPPKRYHRVIPQFLIDFDSAEDSPRFAHASMVASTAHPPPTLPMFLNKSILNGTTPMKDDASVLILPNHTVLNHLATSSIRNQVLATSATTRYKRKVRRRSLPLFLPNYNC